MEAQPIVILGAGGHAKVVIELIRAQGGVVAALTDLNPIPRSVLGVEVVGDDGALKRLWAEGIRHAFVAIGDNRARLRAARFAVSLGFDMVNAISPRASISDSARIGRGVAIMACAAINAEASVADFAIVNTGAVVDHDADLGLACHIGPGAVLGGGVMVGAGALVGCGASVMPGRIVGARTIVGAGGCVAKDLGDEVVAVGVPARVVLSVSEAGS